jgi:CRP-like cAMP-binding protein
MPLFRHLTYQELVRVLNLINVRDFAAGQAVIEEGDEGNEMFIVLEGQVRVHTGDTALTTFGPGQHFGEMALVDRAPRSAAVSADTASKLMVLHRRDFFDIVRKDHDVAVKLLWAFLGVLTDRLRTTSRDLGAAREQVTSLMAGQLIESEIEEV